MEVASCHQGNRTQLTVWRGLAKYTRVRTTTLSCTGSLLFGGFKWYDSAEFVLALFASCVHTPLRVLVVLLNMAI